MLPAFARLLNDCVQGERHSLQQPTDSGPAANPRSSVAAGGAFQRRG